MFQVSYSSRILALLLLGPLALFFLVYRNPLEAIVCRINSSNTHVQLTIISVDSIVYHLSGYISTRLVIVIVVAPSSVVSISVLGELSAPRLPSNAALWDGRDFVGYGIISIESDIRDSKANRHHADIRLRMFLSPSVIL